MTLRLRLLGSGATHFDGKSTRCHPEKSREAMLWVDLLFEWLSHWIGLRENLQETMVFIIKYGAFL